MPLVISVALVALCLVVVAFPFFRRRGVLPEDTDPILELQRQREAIYRELRILQNDYALGDVPQGDYAERLQSYRFMAATLLRQQEHLRELDQRLERETLGLTDVATPPSGRVPCPECGRPVDQKVKQCPSCGTMLSLIALDN